MHTTRCRKKMIAVFTVMTIVGLVAFTFASLVIYHIELPTVLIADIMVALLYVGLYIGIKKLSLPRLPAASSRKCSRHFYVVVLSLILAILLFNFLAICIWPLPTSEISQRNILLFFIGTVACPMVISAQKKGDRLFRANKGTKVLGFYMSFVSTLLVISLSAFEHKFDWLLGFAGLAFIFGLIMILQAIIGVSSDSKES